MYILASSLKLSLWSDSMLAVCSLLVGKCLDNFCWKYLVLISSNYCGVWPCQHLCWNGLWNFKVYGRLSTFCGTTISNFVLKLLFSWCFWARYKCFEHFFTHACSAYELGTKLTVCGFSQWSLGDGIMLGGYLNVSWAHHHKTYLVLFLCCALFREVLVKLCRVHALCFR